MKKLYFLAIALLISSYVKAQKGYNYYEFGIGTGINYVRASTSVQSQRNHLASDINFTYNYSPYIPITAEFQFGTFSGGGLLPTQDSLGRQYSNSYEAFIIHGDFALGEVVDYSNNNFLNVLKNFYFGSGVGAIFNSNIVQRTNLFPAKNSTSYAFPGADNSINLLVPLRFGYSFKIFNHYYQPSVAVDIGYAQNLVFGSGLDGYDLPNNKFQNSPTNRYRQFTFGITYFFGRSTSYRKIIDYNRK